MAEESERRKRARALLSSITEELTAWGAPAEPCWAWHDGGEERALDALLAALPVEPDVERRLNARLALVRSAYERLRATRDAARHHDADEFPAHCDHCPAALDKGTAYRRVQLVLDGSDSFVGGETCGVDMSWELVLCRPCFERLSHWATHPLGDPFEELPLELDDGALADDLAKEQFILGAGVGIEGQAASGAADDPLRQLEELLAGEGDAGAESGQRTADSSGSEGIETLIERSSLGTPEARALRAAAPRETVDWTLRRAEVLARTIREPGSDVRPGFAADVEAASKALGEYRATRPEPCLDPEKMHGYCDQFPGTDDPEDRG